MSVSSKSRELFVGMKKKFDSKRVKRILSFIMAFAMIISLMPAGTKASADEKAEVLVTTPSGGGKGTIELVSGIHTKEGDSYNYGYIGDTITFKAVPEKGWKLNRVVYCNDMASAMTGDYSDCPSMEITAVKDKENEYTTVIKSDEVTANPFGGDIFAIIPFFSPIVSEGEYEIEIPANETGISVDKYSAKKGEAITINATGTRYGYVVPEVKAESAGAIDTTFTGASYNASSKETVRTYTFVMPGESVKIKQKNVETVNYKIKTEPAGLESLVSGFDASQEYGKTFFVSVSNIIGDKYYVVDSLKATGDNTNQEVSGVFTQKSDGVSKYRISYGVYDSDATINIKFKEVTGYDIKTNAAVGEKITVNTGTKSSEGEKVSFSLAADTDNGYNYDGKTLPEVKTSSNDSVSVTPKTGATNKGVDFEFTMPASNVTIAFPENAVKQYDEKNITVEDAAKDYITAASSKARKGQKVSFSVTDTNNKIIAIKVSTADGDTYLRKADSSFEMPDADVTISVVTPALWTDNGNYAENFNFSRKLLNVSTARQLAAVAKKLEENPSALENKVINITKDIDMSKYGWRSLYIKLSKTGRLDIQGNGHTISGLDIYQYVNNNNSYSGFIGKLDNGYGAAFNVSNLKLRGKNNAYVQSKSVSLGMSTSSSGVYGKFDNVDFNIDSDILGNNAEATVNVADIISSMGNMSAINCVSSGKINVASKEIKYFYYKGFGVSKGLKNSYSTSEVAFAENSSIQSGYVCALDSYTNVKNSYFAGKIENCPSSLKSYGSVSSSSKTADIENVFTSLSPAELGDYGNDVHTMDSDYKVNGKNISETLNSWVEKQTDGSYNTWTVAEGTNQPVFAENSGEEFEITSTVSDTENAEVYVPVSANSGRKVTLQAVAKVGYEAEVSVTYSKAGEEKKAEVTKADDGYTYSFVMPSADAEVNISLKDIKKDIKTKITGEGSISAVGNESNVENKAVAGETVTLKVTPGGSSKLSEITAATADGTEVKLTEGEKGVYTFVMPEQEVTVSAVFVTAGNLNADGTLKPGTYNVPVKMTKDDKVSASMAASAVQGATFVVAEDGTTKVTLSLGPVLGAYASEWKYYTEDSCSDTSKLVAATPVKDADGNEISTSFTLPKDAYKWGGVYIQMHIAMMGMTNNAYLSFDYANAKTAGKTFEFGSSKKALAAGKYKLTVSLKNGTDITSDSMAKACLKSAELEVADDGKAAVTVELGSVTFGTLTAYAADWRIYSGTSASGTTTDAQITGKDDEGHVTQIKFELPDNSYDGVFVNMFIDAMNTTQDAYIAMDFANVGKSDSASSGDNKDDEADEKVTEITPSNKKKEFGSSKKVLETGAYIVPAALKKANDITADSAAKSCIKGAKIKVAEDGTTRVTVELGAVTVATITEYAKNWKVYTENGTTGTPVTVAHTKNADGEINSISFNLPDNSFDGVYMSMYVSAMNATQQAYLALDFANAYVDDGTIKASATSHIEQFGEYDIDVVVTAKDGKITAIDVTGKNFAGQYADNNKVYLNKAINGLKDAYIGKSISDVKEIEGVDSVSGATYASHGIRDAIINALGLKATEEIINVPTEKLKEGTYTVDIAYTTDQVAHSLVEKAKNTATIKVDANGKATLTTNIINGTTKEPLYVMEFNGYYAGNDKTKELKKDAVVEKSAVDYTDDVFTANDKVVTKVTIPLEGDYAAIYNTNTKIYVPAMKNLTGEVSGMVFDRGIFSSDSFIKVYWDSLKKQGDSSSSSSSSDNTIKDGTYSVTGSMYKPGMSALSMSDSAIDHTMKLVVSGGRASLTMNFHGMDISGIKGYLGSLSYYGSGYGKDQYGNPTGSLSGVSVESVQRNSDGTVVSDAYGTNYPSVVSFSLIPEALKDGIVPLQVTVPVMEAITAGTGTQNVYLKLDISSMTPVSGGNSSSGGSSSSGSSSSGSSSGATYPSAVPSAKPSATPSASPTTAPSQTPSAEPTTPAVNPSAEPTKEPQTTPSVEPTKTPDATVEPTTAPTKKPAANKAKVGTKVTKSGKTYKVVAKGKVAFVKSKKNTKSVTIPATVKVNGVTCKVTTISQGLFKNNKKLTSVTIGKNITKVGKNAFKGCKKLKTIKFAKGISKKMKKSLKKQIIKAGAKNVKFK